MLELKETYRRPGFEPPGDELPGLPAADARVRRAGPRWRRDGTCSRTTASRSSWSGRALRRDDSPFAPLLEVVVAGLGRLSGRKLARIRRLAAEGPPAEEVGLEPFAPPEVMPTGDPAAGAADGRRLGGDVSQGSTLLYAVLPYAALAIFVVGHLWRYRTDQYGWGARSTQLLESRVLKYASTIFHFGVLAAIGGHVLGLLVPRSWTAAVGLNDDAYHVVAVIGGVAAGGAVLIGFAMLVFRRLRFPRVRVTTTRADVVVFALLAVGIVTGLLATLTNIGETVHYRESVAPYFRNLLILNPKPELMTGTDVTFIFQAHVTTRLAALRRLALQPARPRLERPGRLLPPQPDPLPLPDRAAEAPAHIEATRS